MNKKILYLAALLGPVVSLSAMAYPQYNNDVSYSSNAIVEYQGRVFVLCSDCYSRQKEPVVGNRWSWGNSWDDRGGVGTVVTITAPAWKSGSAYAYGALVSYGGVKYKAITVISAGSAGSRMTPADAAAIKKGWARA